MAPALHVEQETESGLGGADIRLHGHVDDVLPKHRHIYV